MKKLFISALALAALNIAYTDAADAAKESAAQQTKFKVFGDEEVDLAKITEITKLGDVSEVSTLKYMPFETQYFADIPQSNYQLECEKTVWKSKGETIITCCIRKPATKFRVVRSIERPGELEKVWIGDTWSLPSAVFPLVEAMYKLQEAQKSAKKAEGKQ